MKPGVIILLCLFTFSSLGFIKLMEPLYKGYFKDIITRKNSNISTLIVSESAMKAIKAKALFDNNELMHEGKLYDIIAISHHRHIYHIKCKFDKLEQGFIALIDEYVKAIHQNSKDTNSSEINLEKDNSYCTFYKINLTKKQILLYQLNNHFDYSFSSITFQTSDKTLPPQVL